MTDNVKDTRLDLIQNFINKGQFDHNVYTPEDLVKSIVDKLDVDDKKILVLYNLEIVVSLVHDYKVDPNNITFYSEQEKKMGFSKKGMGTNIIKELDTDMKFDVVIGNPPYQDGNKAGGQNKIYNQFSKTALDMIEPDGSVAFITPTSVLKKSKRFSLVGLPGLKYVDFSADEHFNVGVNVCAWIVDKTYRGDVEVKSTVTEYYPEGIEIYDFSKYDKDLIKLIDSIKSFSKNTKDRMFTRNGTSNFKNLKSSVQNDEFKYPLFKLNKGEIKLHQYNSKLPRSFGKTKVNISFSQTLDEKSIYFGKEDFEVNYSFVECTEQEAENVKSFILSDYFLDFNTRWKETTTHGFNDAVYYLPKFDMTKSWTNKEVKEFIESYVE